MPENKIELIKMNDGTTKRITTTNKYNQFTFLGDEYSIDDLRTTRIKEYYKSYHEEMTLFKDKYGRLFLYTFIEQMNFSGGDDRADQTYCLVKDESEADELSENTGLLHGGRMPYVYISESGFVSIHEIIAS